MSDGQSGPWRGRRWTLIPSYLEDVLLTLGVFREAGTLTLGIQVSVRILKPGRVINMKRVPQMSNSLGLENSQVSHYAYFLIGKETGKGYPTPKKGDVVKNKLLVLNYMDG